MFFGSNKGYWLAVLAVLILKPFGSSAQQAASSGPPTDQSDAASLAEIVVTAQKRSESLNHVGATLQAFSADTLKDEGINSVADLVRVIPSLQVATTQANTPVYSLRGVGFYENTLNAAPAVSVYIDEAPMPLSVYTNQIAFDLERVEVLKGPQGTLFGQNSTGGAINYIAAKPTDQLKVGTDLSYGRFNDFNVMAFISGPLTETLSGRLAIKEESSDGWQKSYTRDDTMGGADAIAVRGTLMWKPTIADLKVLLTVSGDRDKSEPQATQYIELATQAGPPTPLLLAQKLAPADPRAADWSPDTRPFGDDKQYNAALRAEWGMSPDLLLTSISNFTNFHRTQFVDPDGLPIQEDSSSTVGNANSLNQELRLSNRQPDSPLQWVFGGNYEYSNFDERNVLYFKDNTTRAYVGQWETNGYDTAQQTHNYAVFGNADYRLTPAFKVKAGLRYTDSRVSTVSCTPDTDRGILAAFFTGLSNSLRGAQGLPNITPLGLGSCINLDNVTKDAQGRIPYTPGAFRDTLHQTNVSWRVGVDYDLSPTTLLYVNIAKSYKAGGFPNGSNATDIQMLPVVQESLLDYEGGFKTQLWERKAFLSGAVFYYDYRNKQLGAKDLDPIFGLLDAVRNIPKSRMIGGELGINATPVRGLNFNAAATYIDSKIQEFIGYSATKDLVSFAGDPMPFAPKFSLTAGSEWSHPLINNWDAFIGFNVLHNSKTYSTVGTDAYATLNAYTTVDGRLGLRSDDDRWQVSVWGKNLFNEYYWTNATIVNDVRVRYAGRPATFGVGFSYRM